MKSSSTHESGVHPGQPLNGVPPLPTQGVATEALRKMLGPLPEPNASRVLVVGCCTKEHFPFHVAMRNYQAACQVVRDATPQDAFQLIFAPEPFEDPDCLIAFAQQQLSDELAGVIFLHATYTTGELGSQFGRWLAEHHTPVLSWSLPDPRGGNLQANSLCCQNFLLNMWRRLGVRYAWTHQEVAEPAAGIILRFLSTARARDRFRQGRVVHVGGSRVTAFYDGEVDELAVMCSFGLRFDRMDLQQAYEASRRFKDSQVQELSRTVLENPRCSLVDVPLEQVYQTLRFGMAIYQMAQEHGYVGATVKSWPELFTCYGCAIDGSVSMLNDAGLCTTEEGEMNGLLSSLAMFFVSEGAAIPTMMDLSVLAPQQNRLGIWHCGACPTRILKQGATYEARRHSILENGDPATAVGMMLEFLLELGPATVARYQSPDAARMISFEGDLVETEMAFRGAYCEMAPRQATAAQIVNTVMTLGLDHHWSLGYGHWQDELRMLNHWIGVQEVALVSDNNNWGLSQT